MSLIAPYYANAMINIKGLPLWLALGADEFSILHVLIAERSVNRLAPMPDVGDERQRARLDANVAKRKAEFLTFGDGRCSSSQRPFFHSIFCKVIAG